LSTVTAVLFDLDDTLLDRSSAFRAVAEQLYASQPALQEQYSREDVVARFRGWETVPPRALIQRVGEFWPNIGMTISELEEWFLGSLLEAIKPDDLATSLLVDLTGAGIPWGIVTNGDAFQYSKLRKVGLAEIMPFAIVSREFGYEKPDPAIYTGFNEAWALRQNTLFVGDNADTDIKGAQGVGMQTAWITLGREFPTHLPLPDYKINHVDELRPILFAPEARGA
jgi:putative hydrolase of the HAD superfamily